MLRQIHLVAATIFSFQACLLALPPGVGPLTFSDEFNGTTLDVSKWTYRSTGPRNSAINTPTAVAVTNGMLVIKTYTELGTNYTGMISSQVLFEQTFGYFEARIRFHTSEGQWSAFWIQSPTIGNPVGDPAAAGVEMDICEHRSRSPATGNNDITDHIQQALIWDGYGADNKAKVQFSGPYPGLSNDTWHTWALSWGTNGYIFLLDDIPIWYENGPVSRRTQYIILSSEVATFFAGPPPSGGYGSYETSTTDMQVDYVHVYQNAATIPPKFTRITRSAPDVTELTFSLSPDRQNFLRASPDLGNWTILQTYPGRVGTFVFRHTNSLPQQFYRIIAE